MPNPSPILARLGRVGYAAKGVVYVIIGVLAARAALGQGGKVTDSRGALETIAGGPFGTLALAVVAIGLLGYMAWRLLSAVTDAEGEGNKPTGLATRAAQAGRGLLYGALGVDAVRLLRHQSTQGGDAARDWSARLLDLPYGRWILAAAGLGVIAFAGYELYRASSQRRVRKELDLFRAGVTEARWIVRFGQFGIAARAVVFALIGVFLVQAAREADPGEAGGLAESLRALSGADYGGIVFLVVALGLLAYGLYQLGTARYRKMRAAG